MRKSLLIGVAAVLAGCGQTGSDQGANQAAANSVKPEKKKPAYCFFKPSETKGWAATRGKDGNVIVRGKAYRQDSRYKAALGEPVVTGTRVEIAPTIVVNDTGFAAPDDWWAVTATIPDSAAIDTVDVKCGDSSLAELKVAPKR